MSEEEIWTMHGLDYDDPACIRTAEELEKYIEDVGFLPFFRCGIPGFSVEEHTASDAWWTGDPLRDPWEWRKILAARGRVAYGRFFDRKTGFISKEWFPAFANYRRDGYDFDARWDDELASAKSKKIMDLFAEEYQDRELFSFEVKQLAGYGGSGEKNFEGEATGLQMQTYLCIRDFRRRRNKNGEEYGWGIAVYCTPEHIWGYDHVTSLYAEEPGESALRIFSRGKELFPGAGDRALRKVLGIKNAGTPQEKTVIPYPDNLVRALRIEGLSAETMTKDQLAGLEVAVGQLVEKQQKTIAMKYREHRKNDEIGAILNRAAGTISTYHSKAMRKLKWPGIASWYLDGYERTLRAYLQKKGIVWPERSFQKSDNLPGRPAAGADGQFQGDDEQPWNGDEQFWNDDGQLRGNGGQVRGDDLCLRVGIGLRQFEGLMSAGICTISDLTAAMQDPDWYKPVRGVGVKSAADIKEKLDRHFVRDADSANSEYRGGR